MQTKTKENSPDGLGHLGTLNCPYPKAYAPK